MDRSKKPPAPLALSRRIASRHGAGEGSLVRFGSPSKVEIIGKIFRELLARPAIWDLRIAWTRFVGIQRIKHRFPVRDRLDYGAIGRPSEKPTLIVVCVMRADEAERLVGLRLALIRVDPKAFTSYGSHLFLPVASRATLLFCFASFASHGVILPRSDDVSTT